MGIETRVALVLALSGGILAGCAGPGRDSGNQPLGGDRRVALYNTDTGEHLNLLYRVKGEVDPQAMTAVSSLFRDRRSGEADPVDPALMDYMSDVVARLGLPDTTEIHITSGYRSPATNAALARTNGNVADDSYHMRGQAADMRVPGVPLSRLAEVAQDTQRGGYAMYVSHVHIDTGPVRTWGRRLDGGGNDGTLEARAKAKPPAIQLAAARPLPAKPALKTAGKAPAGKPAQPVTLAKLGGAKGPPAKATKAPDRPVLTAKAGPAPRLKPGVLLARNDPPPSKTPAKPKAVTPPARKR
jgi:uncharacterized protein YcbK (DUF882 family)